MGSQALNLASVLGFSSNIAGSVGSLQTSEKDEVCYLSGHVLVLHNTTTGEQSKLQGHQNHITCMKITPDKKKVCTADKGEGSLLIVWDVDTHEPVQVLESTYAYGFEAIDVSSSGKYLITVSAPEESQEFALWDLNDLSKGPICTENIEAADKQYSIIFNQENEHEFISNGKDQTMFWTWQNASMKYFSPQVKSTDFKQPIGKFTQSIFLPESKSALTATSDGDVVVWDDSSIIHQKTDAGNRFASKVLRLHSQTILFLVTHGNYLVTGGADGFVRFFDSKLRLVAWFEDLGAGSVTSISFTHKKAESCAFSPFRCPPFIVGTGFGRIIQLDAQTFDEVSHENRAGNCLFKGIPGQVTAMIESQIDSSILLASKDGTIHSWDYLGNTLSLVHADKAPATGMAWLSADVIVLGMSTGVIKFISVITGEEVHPGIKASNQEISKVVINTAANVIAAYDAVKNVLLLKLGAGKYSDRWDFIGRITPHTAPVVDMICIDQEEGESKLYSIGGDGMIFLYDLAGSTLKGGIKLKQVMQIGQGVALTASTILKEGPSGEALMVLADQAGKFRIFSGKHGVQRRIVLSPEYGGMIGKMQIFDLQDKGQCMAFHSTGKVVGLVKLPLDGDPYKSCGIVAHPGNVSHLCISNDGSFMFTADGTGVVNMWDIDVKALTAPEEASTVERYAAYLEGGMAGADFTEIQNYFYYCQLRVQGEDTSAPRHTPGKIPLDQVPYLMRALGYYLSEEDIAIIRSDVCGAESPDSKEISFEEFFVLYMNYRPASILNGGDIQDAFSRLGIAPGVMDKEALIQALTTRGETMTREEIEDCLASLLDEDDLSGGESDGTFVSLLKDKIDHKYFAEDVLGFASS